MECQTIIIGAGMAGLYYINKFNLQNYLILEKENRIGGRVFNIEWHDSQISLGGGVIKSTNTYTLDLCKKFGLKTSEFLSQYHYIDLEGSNPNEKLLFDSNKKIVKKLRDLYNKNSKEILKLKLTFDEFMLKYLDYNTYKMIKQRILYLTYQNADVSYTLDDETIYELFRTNEFKLKYIIPNGYNGLLNKLKENIPESNIKLNSNVLNINRTGSKYIIKCDNGLEYKCERLVLATEKNPKIFIGIPNVDHVYRMVDGSEYIRVYAYWSKGHGITNSIKTPNIPGKIIVMNPNILMACYTEYYNAKRLLELFGKNTKEDNIELLTNLLNNSYINISKPDDFTYKFWNIGTHYLLPGNTFENLRNNIKQIAKNENVHLIGELFAKSHGWVDSALQSVDLLFNDLK